MYFRRNVPIFSTPFRALVFVPPRSPVGVVNNGMNKPVSVLLLARERAFYISVS